MTHFEFVRLLEALTVNPFHKSKKGGNSKHEPW